jgi:gliding motility-associated-like protein
LSIFVLKSCVAGLSCTKIRIKTGVIILFALFGFRNTVDAQCSFDLSTEVIQNSTCISNGIVKVTLSGNEIDLSNVFISLTNGIINEQSSENGHQFGTLPPGSYTVTAQSVCKNTQNTVTRTATVTIASEYTGLNAILSDKRNSLSCINSGMAVINTRNGRLPYKVEITTKPAGYTGETVFTVSSPGSTSFDNLVPGDYVFTVSDDCAYTIPLTVTIDKFSDDFPSNPYGNTLYPSGCNQAYVSTYYVEYHEYWTNYRDFYEIAFTFDDTDTKDWKPADYGNVYIDLPKPYRELYADNAKVKVYLRIKNTECVQLMTELQFTQSQEPQIYSGAYKTCDNYKLDFYLSDESSLCQPFKWEIFDESNTLVASGEDIEYFGTQNIESLLYNKNYTLKVTDKNGTEIVSDISYERDVPYVNGYWITSHSLLTYDLFYDMLYICLPYKIEIYDENDVILTTVEDISTTFDTIRGLEYDKFYKIKIIDNWGNISEINFRENKPPRYVCNEDDDGCNIIYSCDSYSFRIDKPVNVNTPFTWSVKDNGGNVLLTGADSDEIIRELQYGTDYTVVFTDGVNSVTYSLNLDLPDLYFYDDFSEYGYSCFDYEVRFAAGNIVCYPYKLEVSDNDGTVMEESFTEFQYHTVRLDYNKEYTIKIIDSKGGRSVIMSWSRMDDFNLTPYFENSWNYDNQCYDYGFGFSVRNVLCYPYKWEVFDSDNARVASEEGITEFQEFHDNIRLEYNKSYTVKVSDSKGTVIELPYRLDKEFSSINFNAVYYMSNCVYNSYSGYIRIEGQLDADTRVRFVSGPQTPVHTDVVLTESFNQFYPFSTNYQNQEDVPMIAGDYVFEVTSKCEDIYEVTVHCVHDMQAVDFSYTADEVTDLCQGITRVYPKGKIYRNGTPAETWFTMVESPVPEIIGMDINGEDHASYFSLSDAGRYVIAIKNYFYECGIDTIVIDHISKSFSLDGRSSYVCETGTIGHIRVQAKDGKPPYTYTLLNEDSTPVEGIAPNNTGAFEYGAFGEKYVVMAKDDCGKTFPIDIQINTLDQTTLLSGKTNLCLGETIELSCLLLGATVYEWNGPLGFTANTRSISIPNATDGHNGEYTIKVKPAGCDVFFSSSMTVTVHGTPVPDISDPYNLCKASTTHSLSIEPAEGHTVQWYSENEELLTEVPVIDLNGEVADYVFYVTQTENIYGCVSEKTKLNVKINPLPEKNAIAAGWSCENGYPVITVTDIVQDYVYTVFFDSEATNPIRTFTGTDEATSLDLPVTVSDDTIFYLQTATPAGCTLSPGIVEFPVDVTKITVSPDELPVYIHEVPYGVQLESNADEPVFSYTGNLVTGINITPEGLINGTVPASAGREESTFTVTVTDKNGCKTEHGYLLRTCEPAPYLPEDTVVYCQGVQSSPVQASPAEGNSLQWYDAGLNRLTEAPVPTTAVAGEQTFYVSQINEALQCEGPTAKVTVLITPVPVIDFRASADSVCVGSSPSILLENINANYTYHLYSDNTFHSERGSLSGVSSGTVNPEDTLNNRTSYYILVTDSLGCTSSDWLELPVEVVELYIKPEKLPQYYKNVDYEQILLTNAQSPEFTLADGRLPDGLFVNVLGTIYGKVPYSEHSISNIFTVKVKDSNGCIATREYTLNGDVFVPKVFTPNGDGVNDIFMQEYKAVIFDRLGIEIYRGNNGWDGTYQGKVVAADIYFYKLEYTDGNGSVKILTGYVGVHY